MYAEIALLRAYPSYAPSSRGRERTNLCSGCPLICTQTLKAPRGVPLNDKLGEVRQDPELVPFAWKRWGTARLAASQSLQQESGSLQGIADSCASLGIWGRSDVWKGAVGFLHSFLMLKLYFVVLLLSACDQAAISVCKRISFL